MINSEKTEGVQFSGNEGITLCRRERHGGEGQGRVETALFAIALASHGPIKFTRVKRLWFQKLLVHLGNYVNERSNARKVIDHSHKE
jgi:hypothetical protein